MFGKEGSPKKCDSILLWDRKQNTGPLRLTLAFDPIGSVSIRSKIL